MRPRRSWYTTFPPKDRRKLPKEHDCRLFCLLRTNRHSLYSVTSAIGSRIDGILFGSFRNKKRSQKNTITVNPVYSHSGIVPKERTLKQLNMKQTEVEEYQLENVLTLGSNVQGTSPPGHFPERTRPRAPPACVGSSPRLIACTCASVIIMSPSILL